MCGIAGIVCEEKETVGLIRAMTQCMRHRGPDADGFYEGQGVALGHRRLSIIDLSSAANQPFADASDRYVIVFNGEIYNYAALKAGISGYPFRTAGDTEALLAAYAQRGTAALDDLRGMYAFAIWDKAERSLFLARDKMGVKPLYYYFDGTNFLFASEIRAILASGLVPRKLNTAALTEYFRYQSVGAPFTPVEGVRQLGAGCWLKLKDGAVEIEKYWDVTNLRKQIEFGDKASVRRQIRTLMLEAVRRRLVADVPVGAFLSGGIDSSAIVGLMAEAGAGSPNTFNISFDEKEFDESKWAEAVARKFNTRHTRIQLRPKTMLEELTYALDAMDIPTGDGINTYVVSKAVHDEGMRVALTGTGGDELFAGYPAFQRFLRLQQLRAVWKVPGVFRKGMASFLGPSAKKDRLAQFMRLPEPSIEEVYPLFRQLLSPDMLGDMTRLAPSVPGGLDDQLRQAAARLHEFPLYSQYSVAEYLGYTQQTLLKDTDQMAMAHSLEVREPFFDQDLIEYVLNIPDRTKKPLYPKSLLVESVAPLVPKEIAYRKKQGFVFPWREWMKQELRPFCATQIDRIAQREFVRGAELKETWTQFLLGNPNIRWQELWLFVVLEYWLTANDIQ